MRSDYLETPCRPESILVSGFLMLDSFDVNIWGFPVIQYPASSPQYLFNISNMFKQCCICGGNSFMQRWE